MPMFFPVITLLFSNRSDTHCCVYMCFCLLMVVVCVPHGWSFSAICGCTVHVYLLVMLQLLDTFFYSSLLPYIFEMHSPILSVVFDFFNICVTIFTFYNVCPGHSGCLYCFAVSFFFLMSHELYYVVFATFILKSRAISLHIMM